MGTCLGRSHGTSCNWAAPCAGSESGERPPQDEADNPAELLNQQGSVQEAVFGVLYTLSKERLAEGWKFVLSSMWVLQRLPAPPLSERAFASI